MSKNLLGELKLSPLKENGKFVFMNNEIRVNGKLCKGDYIKIFADEYVMKDGNFFLKNAGTLELKMIVHGNSITMVHAFESIAMDEIYTKVADLYRNQFYFGKTEI